MSGTALQLTSPAYSEDPRVSQETLISHSYLYTTSTVLSALKILDVTNEGFCSEPGRTCRQCFLCRIDSSDSNPDLLLTAVESDSEFASMHFCHDEWYMRSYLGLSPQGGE